MSETVRQRVLWLVWSVLLLASLAAVLAEQIATSGLRPASGVSRTSRRTRSRAMVSSRNPRSRLGVDFVHQGPAFDHKLDHIMPQVASMGAAVAVADFDRDGWPDFYVTNSADGSLNHLYRNQGDGTFKDVAAEMGVADVNRPGTGVSMGAVWGDYDNDGYEDLFLYKYGRPELFHNDRGHGFTPGQREGRPAAAGSTPTRAVWLDYDRDGRLDLFLPGYWPEDIDLWHLTTTKIMPESFEYAENGGRKYLFHNLGGGAFEEVSAKLGITSRRWTLATAAADLAGTGLSGSVSRERLRHPAALHQQGRQAVRRSRARDRRRPTPKSGMNASFGDVFNDGRLSIYKTNISEPGVLVQANDLWVPKKQAAGAVPQYDDLASSLGVDLGGWSWGAQFGDLNNDGTLDLYLTNGYVSAGERSSYWYDFAEIAVGHSAIIGDAENWPAMRGRSLSGYQRKRVWINDGAGRFTDVAQVVGVTDTSTTAARSRSPICRTAACST